MKITNDQLNNTQAHMSVKHLSETLTKTLGYKITLNQLFLVFIFSISLIGFQMSFADSVSFDPEINLSNSETNSKDAQIETFGNNVYVIWRDGNNILFSTSTDGGENFDFVDIGDTGSSTLTGNPQLAFSGNNLYGIWKENDAIKFNKSTDNGITFGGASVQLSSSSYVAKNPQIKSFDSNVYSIWINDQIYPTPDEIIFRKSMDNGLTFEPELKIGESDTFVPFSPKIFSEGIYVFVVWQTESDILFSYSDDAGSTFSTPVSVGPSSGLFVASSPEITYSENDLYVIWQKDTDIFIVHSSDNGETFDPALDVGDTDFDVVTPHITSSTGGLVYATWEDRSSGTGKIIFAKSSDNGSSFSFPTSPNDGNLSGDGEAINPKLSVSGSNIHVIWEDLSESEDGDIVYTLSTDGGDTFGTVSNISQDPEFSSEPQIASQGSKPFVVWQDNFLGEIMFRTGIPSSVNIILDKSLYKTNDTAEIIITDPESSGSIIATVTSNTDPLGIQITLNESSLGTFTGNISFTENGFSSENILLVSPGDIISVENNGSFGNSNIYPRIIAFDGGFTEFNLGSIAHVLVTDKNSNLDISAVETIDVKITSETDTEGITLTIPETGPDTGIFGGEGLTDLVFMIGNDQANIGDSITITQNSTEANDDPETIQYTDVKITSTSNPIGIALTLEESGPDTSLFVGDLTFNQGLENSIEVLPGDILTIKHGSLESKALIIPNTNPANGALEVSFTFTEGDIVTATYKNKSKIVNMNDDFAEGGGGGGLVRPSLVVNALARFGGGGSAYSSPTLQLSNLVQLGTIDVPLEVEQMVFNHDSSVPVPAMELGYFEEEFDYPLIIDDKGFVLTGYSTTIETQSLATNTPHTIKFMYYESEGIQHFSLYTNLRDEYTEIHQSDTQVLYNNGQALEIVDPNGFFDSVNFTLNEIDDLKKEIVLDITFAKPMDTSNIVLRAWDPFLNSFDTHILDAITVVPDEVIEPPTPTFEEPVINELKSQTIPMWVKNNAAWWSEEQISDDDFVAGLEYLISNGIIKVPGVQVELNPITEIPDWIKNNAGWWGDSLITDGDFIEAMQWLIEKGVIQL